MSITFVLVLLIFWNIYLQSEVMILRNSTERALGVISVIKETLERMSKGDHDDGK